MKLTNLLSGAFVLGLLLCTQHKANAALITFDNTTASTPNSYLRATKTYIEDSFAFLFEGKDINYLDSNYAGFTGLTEFSGDVLQFSCCRASQVTITHVDNAPFTLSSFYGGTTKTSPNDQGDIFFRATYVDGRVEDSKVFIENGRMLHTFSRFQNLTSLILSRNLLTTDVKSSFPVIDDITLDVFSPATAGFLSAPLPATTSLVNAPTAMLFILGFLVLGISRTVRHRNVLTLK